WRLPSPNSSTTAFDSRKSSFLSSRSTVRFSNALILLRGLSAKTGLLFWRVRQLSGLNGRSCEVRAACSRTIGSKKVAQGATHLQAMRACTHCGEAHPDDTRRCPRTNAAMADDGPIGTLIDRYRVEKLIGAGGFGAVYQAVHHRTNQSVALKVLKKE